MEKGAVSWFNNAKGYGFLKLDSGGKDIFVHYSAITSDGYKSLKEGDLVEFDIAQGAKGPQAENVRVVKMASNKASDRDAPQKANPRN